MAYSHDYQISARRHLKDAEPLYALNTAGAQPGAKAVAGYLYGLAGELAVKRMMIQSGMRPLAAILFRYEAPELADAFGGAARRDGGR